MGAVLLVIGTDRSLVNCTVIRILSIGEVVDSLMNLIVDGKIYGLITVY